MQVNVGQGKGGKRQWVKKATVINVLMSKGHNVTVKPWKSRRMLCLFCSLTDLKRDVRKIERHTNLFCRLL